MDPWMMLLQIPQGHGWNAKLLYTQRRGSEAEEPIVEHAEDASDGELFDHSDPSYFNCKRLSMSYLLRTLKQTAY